MGRRAVLATSLMVIAVGLHTLSFIILSATLSGFAGLYSALGWLLAGLLNVAIYLLSFIFLFLPGYILLLPAYYLAKPWGSRQVSLLMGYDWLLHILAAYQILAHRPLEPTSLGAAIFLLTLSILPLVLAVKTFRMGRITPKGSVRGVKG
jgi:hypothetical protein